MTGGLGVAGSNPAAPTIEEPANLVLAGFAFLARIVGSARSSGSEAPAKCQRPIYQRRRVMALRADDSADGRLAMVAVRAAKLDDGQADEPADAVATFECVK